MTTINYKSDATYSHAVFKYYAFSFVATSFLHIPLGVAGVAMEAPPIAMMLVMAIVQITSWLIVANSMCLTFQTMIKVAHTPPAPPKQKGKVTEVGGTTDITRIKRTYE